MQSRRRVADRGPEAPGCDLKVRLDLLIENARGAKNGNEGSRLLGGGKHRVLLKSQVEQCTCGSMKPNGQRAVFLIADFLAALCPDDCRPCRQAILKKMSGGGPVR